MVKGRIYLIRKANRRDERDWLTIRGTHMAKSRAEMELVAKLLAEYGQFQRSRPDLPQGDLRDLSEEELEILAAPRSRSSPTTIEE
jgi:hypothetical protein